MAEKVVNGNLNGIECDMLQHERKKIGLLLNSHLLTGMESARLQQLYSIIMWRETKRRGLVTLNQRQNLFSPPIVNEVETASVLPHYILSTRTSHQS